MILELKYIKYGLKSTVRSLMPSKKYVDEVKFQHIDSVVILARAAGEMQRGVIPCVLVSHPLK